ncbi:MAG: hypothetical protein ABI345_08395 [Jatrophihabitans sp.]
MSQPPQYPGPPGYGPGEDPWANQGGQLGYGQPGYGRPGQAGGPSPSTTRRNAVIAAIVAPSGSPSPSARPSSSDDFPATGPSLTTGNPTISASDPAAQANIDQIEATDTNGFDLGSPKEPSGWCLSSYQRTGAIAPGASS